MIVEGAIQTENLLALTQCPRCDYELRGLPADGSCPECGRPYDQQSIFLCGWAAGGKRSPWWIVAILYSINIFVYWQRHAGAWVAIPIVITLAMLIVLQRYLSRPSTRVKLSAAGCAQYLCPSSTALMNLDSRPLYAGSLVFFLLFTWWIDEKRTNGPLTFVGLAMILMTIIIHRSIEKSRVAAEARGEYFDEHETFASPTPWSQARVLVWEAATIVDRPRIRIASSVLPSKSAKIFVDADVICSPHKAATVQQQIEQWQAEQAGVLQTASMKI